MWVLTYKKEHCKLLSLATETINAIALLNSFITRPMEYVFIPGILRYCDCTARNTHSGSAAFFNFLVQPLFVCGVGIFQLVLVRKGPNALKFKIVSVYLVV